MTTPSTTRTGILEVPGGRLAFDVAGDGPPLVLVHAGITDRRMWDDVWDDLATDHTLVRYDTRGYGDTRILDTTPYSNRADLIAVLDELGIARAALCGVSRSGSIVLDTTLEFPERVSALIPVAAGLGGFDPGNTPDEQAAEDRLVALEEARAWPALVEEEMRVWVDGLTGTPDRVPEVRRRAAAMDLHAYQEHAGEPEADVIPLQPRAVDRLGEIRVPTLVMVGDLDTPSTIASCRQIALGVPGARLVVLAGVAHLPPMERPGEFAALVREFLAGHRAG